MIKRKRFTKFLGVILEECITWKDHIRKVQNKIAKILINYTKTRKSICFSYIHTYYNYAGIARSGAQENKLKTINIFHEDHDHF